MIFIIIIVSISRPQVRQGHLCVRERLETQGHKSRSIRHHKEVQSRTEGQHQQRGPSDAISFAIRQRSRTLPRGENFGQSRKSI